MQSGDFPCPCEAHSAKSSFYSSLLLVMATLVDRYSSMSVKSCLSQEDGRKGIGLLSDPMVDQPLLDRGQRSFAVPPGIEVCLQLPCFCGLIMCTVLITLSY